MAKSRSETIFSKLLLISLYLGEQTVRMCYHNYIIVRYIKFQYYIVLWFLGFWRLYAASRHFKMLAWFALDGHHATFLEYTGIGCIQPSKSQWEDVTNER